MRRAPWQLRVGIQGQNETDIGQQRQISNLDGEAVVLALDEAVEVEQLAALTLPAHPDAFARIVDAMAVVESKGAEAVAGIFLVQLIDQPRTKVDQRIFFVRRLG